MSLKGVINKVNTVHGPYLNDMLLPCLMREKGPFCYFINKKVVFFYERKTPELSLKVEYLKRKDTP